MGQVGSRHTQRGRLRRSIEEKLVGAAEGLEDGWAGLGGIGSWGGVCVSKTVRPGESEGKQGVR